MTPIILYTCMICKLKTEVLDTILQHKEETMHEFKGEESLV